MKKVLVMVLAAGMSVSLAACGSPSKDQETTASTTPATEAETAASDGKETEAAENLGDFKMIIGHAQPEGNPRFVSLEKFAADVEEKTDGHVKVTVYGNGQLGTEKEMLEQVVEGTIQGMRGGQFDFCPRLQMFTAPFMTQTREQVTALLQSDLAKKVSAEAEQETGTVIINLCDGGGYRQFSNNIRPIKKPDDLKGLKIRTNGMKTYDLAFQTMGASTVTIPYADLYMSLKTGVADGQDNSWGNVVSMKFYEVQKYFTEVNYVFAPDPFYVNGEWWHSLPEEYQKIIVECATAMGEYNDQLIDEGEEKAKQDIIASGAELYIPTEEELQAFIDAVQPVYQQMIEEGFCTQEEMDQMWEIVNNLS